MPYRKLFLSRWSALLWAGGILWTAIDVADLATPVPAEKPAVAAPRPSSGDARVDGELALLSNVIADR